ncbi:protein kleE [Xanthomonas euvesicatoria]
MSNIVKFPKEGKPPAPEPVQPAAPGATTAAFKAEGRGLVAGVVKFVWVTTVLVWPVLKWVLSIITFFQFVRMLYHWNTPGVYASWSFLAYFAALTASTYFVSIYKPKGL